jgi:hypothetical protein
MPENRRDGDHASLVKDVIHVHISAMAKKTSTRARKEPERSDSRILGRSEATGRYVFKPVSRGGSVSMKQINAAVKNALGKKS